MLYVIGLGLADERDITLKGLEAVKKCDRVYLEAYTSVLMVDASRLEALYGKPVIVADRDMVEQEADAILKDADKVDVAFLVVGDPYGATTHADLALRARARGIAVRSIHNASIMNAIGCCGLQLYNYGVAVSIVFFDGSWRPDSFYDKIKVNRANGMHTLCLLDIKVKEQSLENLARGRRVYEPPRFLSVNQAVEQLLEIEERRGEGVYSPSTAAVGLARVGCDDQQIVAGTLSQLSTHDFGAPLHSLVIPGAMHFLELDAVLEFALDRELFRSGAVVLEH